MPFGGVTEVVQRSPKADVHLGEGGVRLTNSEQLPKIRFTHQLCYGCATMVFPP